MTWLFLILATVGGTILICQFVLTLIGLGHDVEIADDLPDDIPHDMPHDVGHAVGHECRHGGDHGAGHADSSGHAGEHSGAWLVGIISFRTLVAASAFFGLSGLASQAAGLSAPLQLVLAAGGGGSPCMAYIGSCGRWAKWEKIPPWRVQRAVGLEGSVYVPIPAGKQQAGKVQVKLQGRLMELEAVTAGNERLPTGTKVRVVAMEGTNLVVESLASPPSGASTEQTTSAA